MKMKAVSIIINIFGLVPEDIPTISLMKLEVRRGLEIIQARNLQRE